MIFAIFLCLFASAVLCQDTFYGIDYGVNIYACPSYDSIESDFSALKSYTSRIRIYGLSLCNQGALAMQATQQLGMRLYLGIWVDGDPNTFETELAALQRLVDTQEKWDNIDGLIVGSEILYRNDVTPDQLIAALDRARAVLPPSVAVTTADTYDHFSAAVLDHVDFVMMQGVSIEQAWETLLDHYQETVKRLSTDKPIRISETGWPSAGPAHGSAEASLTNQRRYLRAAVCGARTNGIEMLYFSAQDEAYKGGVEAHFGFLSRVQQQQRDLDLIC
ncbi:glycoside hydrolase superfamily [Syncephalastrum racemosum]|uniref:glucan endo-1,3-beta-D-glucosidase n=1 Tax=Syncephalastrum racemosum TaxID=13706 RepID=A0A1X2H7P7_SYNRA|nr:glycoside hydrolase superfamily [Syncephalastrum racemosum]